MAAEPDVQHWSKEKALAQLEANSTALLAAVEGLSKEELAKPVTLILHSEMTMPLAN